MTSVRPLSPLALTLLTLLWGAAWAPLAAAQPIDLATVNDRQIKRGLTFASDSTVALSAGPGVGGANFRLKRSTFFKRISSTQIKLRIYVTPNLNVQEGVERGVDIVTKIPDSVREAIRKRREAQSHYGRWGPEGEDPEEYDDHSDPDDPPPEDPEDPDEGPFDFMGAAPDDPTPYPRIRLFVLLNYGSATARNDFPVRGVGRSEFVLSTSSYRVGVGVKVDLVRYFSVLPTFSVSYNHIRGDGEGNGLDSALLRLQSNRKLVNWRTESYTLIPEVELRFNVPWERFEFRTTVELSYLETRSFSSSTSLHDFTSRSLIAALTFEFDWNTRQTIFGMDLHVIPAMRYVRIEGDAKEALGSNELIGAEFSLVLNTTDRVPFSSRLGVRATYLWGVDLEAWSVGVAHEF